MRLEWSLVIFPNTDDVKMGMTIEANSNIILQMHYPAGSLGQVDSTAIHLYFMMIMLKILEKYLSKDY